MRDNQTFQLGLIGYPLGHSLSPRIHRAALDALGLIGDYRLYPVSPLPAGKSDLISILERVKDGRLQGLNVTIPHKTSVLPWMEELTPPAMAVGAVNTVYTVDDFLVGDNTDIPGFIYDLSTQFPKDTEPGVALILGAGGSARAVAFALQQTGWLVNVAARRIDQAERLLEGLPKQAPSSVLPDERFGPIDRNGTALELSFTGLEEFVSQLNDRGSVLVVNTTPVGMEPYPEATPWPNGLPLPLRGFVYDLVYNPPETRLVRQARLSGLSAANGLGMLVEQAAIAFERWTGLPAPRRAMIDSVGTNPPGEDFALMSGST